jgi:hypothetical protein
LGAALTPGSSVIKHLKQDQYLEVYRSKRKQLKKSKQVRNLTSSKLFEPNSTPIHFSTDISSSGVIFKDVLPGINSLCRSTNHWFGNSTLLRIKVLGAALKQGSSVIKHLKQDQYLEVNRSKRTKHGVYFNT